MEVCSLYIFDKVGDLVFRRCFAVENDSSQDDSVTLAQEVMKKSSGLLPDTWLPCKQNNKASSPSGLLVAERDEINYVLKLCATRLRGLQILQDFHVCLKDTLQSSMSGDILKEEENLLKIANLTEIFFDPRGKASATDVELVRCLLPRDSKIKRMVATLTDRATSEILSKVFEKQNLLNNSISLPRNSPPTSALGKGSGHGLGGGGLMNCGSDVWWRRSGVRYAQEEFLLDVVDYLSCTINRTSRVLFSTVSGKVFARSKLSGLPECKIAVDGLSNVASLGLGNCCTRQKCDSEENSSCLLSIVPPDGDFELMNYLLRPAVSRNRQPPVDFACCWVFEDKKGKITVRFSPSTAGGFSSRLQSSVKLDSTLWTLEETRFSLIIGCFVPLVNVTCSMGHARYSPRAASVIWDIGTLSPSISGNMEIELDWSDHAQQVLEHLTFASEGAKEPSSSDRSSSADVLYHSVFRGYLDFRCPRWNLSGLSIPHVDIKKTDGTSPPYKGCRYTTIAKHLEYRF